MKAKLFLFAAVIFLLSFVSCGKKEKAKGNDDIIYVIADSNDYAVSEPILNSVLGKIIYTPQPETSYTISNVELSKVDDAKGYKNILIVSSQAKNSKTAALVNSILTKKEIERLDKRIESVFTKNNLWAEDQQVMIISAENINSLQEKMLSKSNALISYFQKENNKRLIQNLYTDASERKDIERRFLENYGWTIFIQENIWIELEKPNENFVWLKIVPEEDTQRWIFIHWKNNASPDFLNPDSIINERNYITSKFYNMPKSKNKIIVNKQFSTTSETNLKNSYTLATQGLWETSDKSKGGPFLNYTLYDEKQKRIYMLDGSIYAPKYYKKEIIRQMDIILQTFTSASKISDKRKKELLSNR